MIIDIISPLHTTTSPTKTITSKLSTPSPLHLTSQISQSPSHNSTPSLLSNLHLNQHYLQHYLLQFTSIIIFSTPTFITTFSSPLPPLCHHFLHHPLTTFNTTTLPPTIMLQPSKHYFQWHSKGIWQCHLLGTPTQSLFRIFFFNLRVLT